MSPERNLLGLTKGFKEGSDLSPSGFPGSLPLESGRGQT